MPIAPPPTDAPATELITQAANPTDVIERHPAFQRVQQHVQQQLCEASFTGRLPQPTETINDVIQDELGDGHPLVNNDTFMANVMARLGVIESDN